MILAGGRSRRMGRPKESLPFGDRTMLQRTVATLLGCTSSVIVVRRDEHQTLSELPGEVHVIDDRPPSRGPLAAIATGLCHARDTLGFADADALFVTGCDSPFLRSEDVRWLADRIGEHELVMPIPGGIPEPLCAIYRVSTLRIIEDLLARGTDSPRTLAESPTARLLDDHDLTAHDPHLRFLRNVNTPTDYDHARDDL